MNGNKWKSSSTKNIDNSKIIFPVALVPPSSHLPFKRTIKEKILPTLLSYLVGVTIISCFHACRLIFYSSLSIHSHRHRSAAISRRWSVVPIPVSSTRIFGFFCSSHGFLCVSTHILSTTCSLIVLKFHTYLKRVSDYGFTCTSVRENGKDLRCSLLLLILVYPPIVWDALSTENRLLALQKKN